MEAVQIRLFAVLCFAIVAVTASAGAQDAVERRDELASVEERINDPDPLMRLTNFEEIADSDDPLVVELAIRHAMAIDDEQLRSLAMRHYVATLDTVSFEWLLPPELDAEMKSADGDRKKEDAVRKSWSRFLSEYEGVAGLLTIGFDELDPLKTSFKAYTLMRQRGPSEDYSGAGRFVGSKMIFRSPSRFANNTYQCTYEIRPTDSLELAGIMRCEGFTYGKPMEIRAQMF